MNCLGKFTGGKLMNEQSLNKKLAEWAYNLRDFILALFLLLYYYTKEQK